MKNFTKQITNKTLFKPTRWLLMALMLLLGTSSAWAAVYVVGNAFESWDTFTPMKETNGKHYYPILHPVNDRQFKLSTQQGWGGEVKGLAGSTSDTRFTFGSNNNNHTIKSNVTNGLLAYDPSGGDGKGWIWTEDYSICVAGASGLTGDNWNTTADPMTYSNGVWSVKFSGVNAGTYQFKVVAGNYLWETTSYDNSKGDLDCSVVDGNISITTPSKGDVTIYFDGKVYVTYKSSCSAPTSVTIDGAPQVKPCPGDEVTLNSSVSGGTGDITYSWSVSGTGWSIKNSANKNSSCTFVVGTETGTINLSATQCSTKKDATVVTINVKSKLTKSNYTLQASADWTGNAITPTIQPGSGIPTPTTVKYGASAATATTTAPTAVGSYKVYISTDATDSYCAATDLEIGTFNIVCPDVDAPTIGTITNIIKCGDDVTTNGSFTFTNVPGLTYTCDGGTVGDGTVTGINAAGTYTLTATNGCGGTATKKVTISETQNKKTLTAISGNPLVCAQKSASLNKFSVNDIDGAKYYWSIVDRVGMVGTLSKDAGCGNNCHITGLETGVNQGGSATLQVYAEYESCRTDTKTLALKQLHTNSDQAATISGETSMCADATQTLTVSNALGNIDPQWTSSNTAVATVEANGKVTAIATGTANITYSILTACGDRLNSNSFAITVGDKPTSPYIAINNGANAQVCANTPVTITANAVNATKYTLFYEDGEQIGQPVTAASASFEVTEAAPGTYNYTVEIENGCGSITTNAVQLTVTPVPTFTKEPSAVTLCSSATSITVANLISATGAEVDVDDATITLYNENGEEVTENIDINVTSQRTTNYKLKASKSTCSSEFKEFTLTVNPIPAKPDFGANSEFVCQRTTVNLPTELNSVQLRWYSDQNRKTLITSFQANAQKIVYAAAYNGTCESAELTPYTYDIYPVPTITVTRNKTSAICNEYVTVTANVTNRMDGVLVYWYEGDTQVGTGDEYTFTKKTATTVNNLRAEIGNSVNCDPVSAKVPDITFEAHENCGPSYVQGKIVYLQPNDAWKNDGAWFAAYFFGDAGNYWMRMYNDDGDDTWACEVPDGNYDQVIFVRKNKNNQTLTTWDNKLDQTADLTLPSTAKKYSIQNSTWYDLDSPKTFKTIALNAGASGTYWNTDNAAFYVYAWNSKTSAGTDPWPRMIDSDGDGVYVVDVNTEYDRILFQRANPSGGEWNRTADLVLDIYGNEFKIEDINGHGYWHWRWFQSTYDLGVQTNVVEQNGENQEIHCTGVVYKTDCAPGIKYGFEYATNEAMTNPTYVECGQGYMAAGTSFEKYITVEPGEYYVRAKAQYENNAAVYGGVKKVVIANQCDANYEFAVGNTSTTVQACGGNRVLPALEIISDKNVGGGTITWSYEWKNSDGSAATNLSAANIASPTFNGTASQTYKVRVIKKVNGTIKCAQTAEYQVVYDDNSPKGAIDAPATVQINQEVMLQGSINNSEGFTWMVKEGSVDVTSLMLSDATILNPTFNTKEAGVYTITLTPDNNFTCEATPIVHTLTVAAPTENCGSNDIEVKFDFNKAKPNWFNGSDIYYTYKTNGGDCAYTSKGNDNKLNSSKPSFTIDATKLTDADFPITIYFISQSDYNHGGYNNKYAYAKGSITKDDLGKLLTYNIKNDANPKSYTKIDACIDDVNTIFEANLEETEAPNVSISAPTVTSPTSIVEGTATQATLMAYLSATGCSAITAYGFQYIMQDDEPTSAAGATKKTLSLPVTIGKSFKTTLTGLAEGVYWFRGYATNQGGKTGYTAWSSFTIITDGPYPTLQCASGALQLLANGKIQVIVTNQGNEPVLQGSYSLNIVNQGATMAFAPLPVPAIAANSGTATFTTTNPVANKNNYSVTATLTYKGRKQQCSIKACTPQIGGGDTIFYTVDAAAVTDKCMLVFPTVYEAIDHLKASTAADGFVTKDGDGYMLKQPVVMQVVYAKDPYKGNVRVGTTGGMTDGRPEPLIISLTNINNDGNTGNGTYHPLIIRAANPNAKPALQHIAIRKSRNVILDNLNLISSETDIDNAIDIDNNNNNWVANEIGRFANANVTVKNCLVKSKGFTCMHVSAVTKVYFINNEILADLSDDEINHANTRQWGASAKFIRCKDILFLRNNFTGTHATSVWLQGVEGALLMNNVFWNNNKISTGKTAMVRIVQQSSPEEPKNIGIYYNTMYLADCDRGADPKFDFLTLNSDEAGAINHNGDFETSSIEFMYNNCYSYDDKTPGKSTDPFKGRTPWAGLCHNNFWSVKDQNTTPAPSISAFAFGTCDVNYVNVKNNVCTTTASDPNSLVIKRSELNTGEQPNTALAIQLGANLVVSDRTREDIRPTTPTIIDPDDVPSGVVDAGGNAPSIALVVSDEAGNQTMTHTIDVVTYVGATRGTDYTAELESAENFTMNDNANGTVTVSFNKDGKTKNLTYSDNLIVSKSNVDDIIIPITGKYVASYTGGWTLGAYQQTETIATDSIIWQGSVSDDWDNRNNWLDAKTKTTLTCVNTLAKDLKVIIPAPHSENYPAPDEKGIVTYPKLPAFDIRDAQYGNEIVNAGQGDNNEPTQFADHIYMEYGAALQGVENLVDDDVRRYNEATTHLTVDREKWFLVGNMVQPFTNVNKTETRLTISGDYYIPRQEPRVYMHQITVEENEPAWQHTFAELDVTIQPTEVFAISIPDLYGSMRFNAQRYYTYVSPNVSKLNDGVVPKSYTFNGRFINESEPLTFTGLSSSPVLVNNTYPCNLSASAIENGGLYTVYLYDHDKNSWVSPKLDGSSKIKPQHGFAIIKKKGDATLAVTTNMLANGNTYHYEKSANATMPYHVIELYNANSTDGYASQIQVVYDAEKGTAQLDARDAEKLWSNNTMVPDLYMMMYDATLQRLYVEKPEMVIPLGVRLQQDMDVTFKMAKTNGIEKAILEDRLTGKEYDLTGNKEATITGLEVGKTGVIEGRFYLNLVAEDQFNFDTPTDITDAIVETNSINIYVSNGNNLSVLANNVDLQTVYVSDMSGRTQRYDVSGNYANITLPVSQGVYVVQVIGDNLTRTDKVVIK